MLAIGSQTACSRRGNGNLGPVVTDAGDLETTAIHRITHISNKCTLRPQSVPGIFLTHRF
jgi:hypothetical protein